MRSVARSAAKPVEKIKVVVVEDQPPVLKAS